MPEIQFPTVLQSECIFCVKATVTSCKVTIYWSGGSLRFWIGVSTDPNTDPTEWQEVTGLISGTEKQVTLTIANKAVYYRIIKDYDTIIATQTDSIGRITAPGLEIKDFVTS